LKEIADGNTDTLPVIELAMRQEARRAYQAISGTALPPMKGVFADGKKDMLHQDERLQVKLVLKLRFPRPKDVLKRLEQATSLKFSFDANIDPEAVVGNIYAVNVEAWKVMRQMASAASIQGAWEDLGDGYRLTARTKVVRKNTGIVPRFRDDSFDPLPEDPRLNKKFTIQMTDATVPDLLKRIQDETGVVLTMDKVDPETPLYKGVSWPDTNAWTAMRNIAEAPKVDGAWEKVGAGYRLRGNFIRPPGVPVANPVAPDGAPAPQKTPIALLLAGGIFGIILIGAAVVAAVAIRQRRGDAA
jgi:hypothetical protein